MPKVSASNTQGPEVGSQKPHKAPGMVACTCNPRAGKAEAGQSGLGGQPAHLNWQVSGQQETLSPKTTKCTASAVDLWPPQKVYAGVCTDLFSCANAHSPSDIKTHTHIQAEKNKSQFQTKISNLNRSFWSSHRGANTQGTLPTAG